MSLGLELPAALVRATAELLASAQLGDMKQEQRAPEFSARILADGAGSAAEACLDPAARLPRLGCDLCPLARIQEAYRKRPQAFVQRILAPEEQLEWEALGSEERRIQRLLVLYAAKEALAKALGLGLGQAAQGRLRGLRFTELIVLHDAYGAPRVQLQGEAQQRYTELGGRHIALSLSHDAGLGLALALIS